VRQHAIAPRPDVPLAFVLALLGALALVGPASGAEPTAAAKAPRFAEEIVPLLRNYCWNCHSTQRQAGGVILDAFADEAAARKDASTWDQALRQLRSREMPPPRSRQPAAAERDLLVRWIEGQTVPTVPTSRPALRRLNRSEYANTLRDLLGVEPPSVSDLPADEIGHGFDNIGELLSLSPLLFEKYLGVAEKAVTAAFRSPEAKARILIAQPTRKTHDEVTARVLEQFTKRAYRRPVMRDEIDRLVGMALQAEAEGESWERGIQVALQAVLVSPHFLFRVESGVGKVRPPDDYALASRLSYFLWSSMPDEELFDLAAKRQLSANVPAQVRRMLKSPKAGALVENFAGQWLQLRSLANVTPDPKRFPGFDDALRTAMRRETELFFNAVVREDRSVLDFLDADFTFLNERLAKHYGIDGIKGPEFRRVTLIDGTRGGVLTQASVLTVTSNPTRTSPVKRGKWVLENLLGAPPPAPPPDTGDLPDDRGQELTGTLRQRMEQHRSNPNCATCHQRLDPLGFGLENFDAVGRWRTRDGSLPIDASGTLLGGESFNGPAELKAVLKGRRDEFTRALAEKMLTYAAGRGMGPADRPAVERVRQRVADEKYTFSSLILAVVESEPFGK
jgi:hypothetical protein